jgi:VWFA-related protein
MKIFKLAIAFLLVSSLLPAQQPDQQPLDVLSLKSRSDLVLVPVVVRDKHGKHVPGLTKDSFRLEENAKDQIISLFEEVQAPANAPSPIPVPGHDYSNLPFDNTHELRLTILLLDLLNTTELQRADGKDDLIKFLSKTLPRNQPVSLVTITQDGLHLVHPFTADTTVLIQALKKLSLGPQPLMPRNELALETLKQLREIAHAYTGIPGRKTLILAAGNIPDPQIEASAYDSGRSAIGNSANENSAIGNSVNGSSANHSAKGYAAIDNFQETWNSLIDANIAVYPIQLMVWAVRPGSRNIRPISGDATLREFAEATGGNFCLESNDLTGCMAEAVEDSRSYYMLGFSVRPDDRKPGWRNLKVKVSAEHVNLRARNGFYYGPPALPGSPPSVRDAEINALASSLAYSAIPMYVRVLPPAPTPPNPIPAPPDKKTKVEFLVTIPLGGIKIDPTSAHPLDLEIGGIALTPKMKEAAEFLHPVQGNPNPELLQKFTRDGISLNEKLELPPGAYDIRIMTRDNNTAQIGTVVFPLEVK